MVTAALILVSPIVGSFLGVVVRRLGVEGGLLFGRSRCDRCRTTLGPVDLLPLLGFALNRGHCRTCGAPIGWFHPAIELAALGVAVWAASLDTGLTLAVDCGLGWALLALAWIDAERFLLPDALTLPLILAGLGWCLYDEPDALALRAGGAVAGFLLFAGVSVGYRLLRGRDGLGAGDAKLLAAAGAWTGIDRLGVVILLAALGGLGFATIERLRGRQLSGTAEIPFGPFLAGALWLVWLYADRW